MTVRLNPKLIRIALGCIQPAGAEDIQAFIESTSEGFHRGNIAQQVSLLIELWASNGDIVCVHKKSRLYSLTKQGDSKLTKEERRLRDRSRLFLLKEMRAASRLDIPEAGQREKADVSSAIFIDLVTQEEERPIGAAAPPRRARSAGRAYCPLLSKQLFVGSSSRASGPTLRFLSFQSAKGCALAHGHTDVPEFGLGASELALALGVSPRLFGALLHQPEKHYRTFQIPKANGKPRTIRAPRTMMKMVQYFLLDYILASLPVHEAATAYSPGCSVRANALPHVRQRYVANIDVADFFPSLTTPVVYSKLISAGIAQNTARVIARICSFGGGLPQGAPTSAALSNIILFDFDSELSAYCKGLGLSYTRYADDISLSGENKESIEAAIQETEKQLHQLGLALNKEKTRLAGPGSKKIVTGVVVNEYAQPSRTDRRRLRAMLHHASKETEIGKEIFYMLQGKASYMLSFASEGRSIGALPKKYVEPLLRSIRTSVAQSAKE